MPKFAVLPLAFGLILTGCGDAQPEGISVDDAETQASMPAADEAATAMPESAEDGSENPPTAPSASPAAVATPAQPAPTAAASPPAPAATPDHSQMDHGDMDGMDSEHGGMDHSGD